MLSLNLSLWLNSAELNTAISSRDERLHVDRRPELVASVHSVLAQLFLDP